MEIVKVFRRTEQQVLKCVAWGMNIFEVHLYCRCSLFTVVMWMWSVRMVA